MQKTQLILDLDLAQALVNYLQTKPFVEVHQFINALANLPRMPEPAPDAPKE